jgi:amino acid transporter
MNDHKSLNKHPKLGEWFATAICGNDILSSSLYVSGIAIIFAGVYAPIVLAFIGFILFLYKKVYTEVVEALPINGGAYNCLLNGTSKTVAALAGVMTILSYVATAVISAKVGIEYLHTILPEIPVIPVTIALLFLFAVIVILGIKDSAKVALGIFSFHALTLLTFLGFGLFFFLQGHSFFAQNIAQTQNIIHNQGNLFYSLYLGFAASLLGVSGFESSANFVEEQEKGVFRKTLRNMLAGVAFFNPLIALVVLNSMPFHAIEGAKDFLLSDAAYAVGGQIFRYVVVIDAFLVLAGAVLTAYVGVSGLIHRMASDSCLPYFLTTQNKKGSFPKIILCFFLLCSSILLVTRGDLLSLAGVYTIAFLGVMTMFGLGNLILKQTRTELKRTYNAPILAVIVACLATLFGIFGNIRINPNNLTFFEIYFIPSFILVLLMVYQDYVMRFALKVTKNIPFIHKFILANFQDIIQGRFVVFVNHIERLYNVLEYVNKNETGWNVVLVHCRNWDMKSDKDRYNELKAAIPPLQKAGVFPHLNITTEYEDEPFGPQAIENVAKRLKIHKNRIMIGSIHHFHDFDYDELGGVRIIF